MLSEGSIVAVKGNGGYHLATSTLIDTPLQKLRSAKDRKQKPFAIMARDINSVKSFTTLSDLEELLLLSPAHPITILEKSSNYYLSELIAPRINNVGVMLPYSGLHLMLFNKVDDPAFVMTSANKPNEPIIQDDNEALKTLTDVVDYILCHNRSIAQRCDDSVVKIVDNHRLYIRRSRGYAPKPILIKSNGEVTVGLGAELNVTACILVDGKAFLSQHIGDIETYESLKFLEAATKHLLSLIQCKPERVACDLHPQFNSTLLAEQISEKLKIPLFRIQHHHAHTAKLMAEHGIDEVVCITCDGFGMGLDRKAWGGEIFYSNKYEFKRLAHLEEHRMIGGDLATKYPLRMAASILNNKHEFQDWLLTQTNNFTYGKTEVQVIIKDAKDGKGIYTSSCGRLLDAAAAILDICHERTYEGEPALKLESAAIGGRDVLDFDPIIKHDILLTKPLIEWLFDKRAKYPLKDLAYTVHTYLAKGLALLAIREAERLHINHIGFTGGVAYNQLMIDKISSIVSKHNLRLLLQQKIPCGDGGISLGQAFAASIQ
jgi:hydrogenase maturation protein HypF